MSLRNYLFYLMGGLILLISVFQVAFIFWAQQNFKQEVQTKAQEVSLKMIDMAVDNIDTPNFKIITTGNGSVSKSLQKSFTIETENLISDVKIIADQNIKQETKGDNKNKQEDNAEMVIDITKIKKTLHANIEKLHQQASEGYVIFDSIKQQSNLPDSDHIKTQASANNTKTQQWVFQAHSDKGDENDLPQLTDFIQMVLLAIAASTIIALGFAFWLSGKFSQPMQALSRGFRQLAQGDFKLDVVEQGVEETRQTIRNFNQMKARLQQLSINEKQLQQKTHLAELGEVSLGLAHALRNPIHTIGLSVEQLNNNQLSAQQREQFIEKIQSKIAHIDKTIRALLTLTTTGISRDKKVIINAVIKDIILEYKANDFQPLNFEVEVDQKLQLIGCEDEIRAILHTLIINACEASKQNQTISISAIETGSGIVIKIKDQGSGLSEKVKAKLFQPHITSKAEGAGMGLYIAERLISLFYQGNIELCDNNDKGCTASANFYSKGLKDE